MSTIPTLQLLNIRLFVVVLYCFLCNSFNALAKDTFEVYTPTGFLENKGQVKDHNHEARNEVKFSYASGNAAVFFEENKVVYSFSKNPHFDYSAYEGKKSLLDSIIPTLERTIFRMDLEFLNANENIEIIPQGKKDFKSNYYNNTNTLLAGVSSYESITYKNIYDKIDVVFMMKENGVKYDIVLNEGANLSDVKLFYNGAERMEIQGNELILHTPLGELHEQIPLSFINGDKKAEVEVKYQLKSNVISFDVPEIDYSQLTIDPTLTWATYYETASGAGAMDYNNIVADSDGNLFLVSATFGVSSASTDYPVVGPGGSYQQAFGGNIEMYIAKFNSNRSLVWATYFGGSGTVWALGTAPLAIHGSVLHIVGSQGSTAMPLVNGGGYFESTAVSRPFYLRFNKNTGALLHSTNIGGHSSAHPSISISNSGLVAIVQNTYDFGNPPVRFRSGAFNQSTNGGFVDVFLMLLNSSYSQIWGTFLGGPGTQSNSNVTFDSNNNIFIVTESTWNSSSTSSNERLKSLSGAYNQLSNAGGIDLMITKFSSGGALLWNTLYGGSNNDGTRSSFGNGIRVITNSSNEVIITGSTSSIDFPTMSMSGAYNKTTAPSNTTGGGTGFDSFNSYILKFNNNGARQWATYWGHNTGGDFIEQLVLTNCNESFLISRSNGATPITFSGYYNQGTSTGTANFMMKFNSNFNSVWSSYIGSQNTRPRLAYTPFENRLYHSQSTWATNLPTKNPGGGAFYDPTNSGSSNSSFAIWEFSVVPTPPEPTIDETCLGATVSFPSAPSGLTYYLQGSSCGTSTANPISGTLTLSPGTYYANSRSLVGCWSTCVSFIVTSGGTPGGTPGIWGWTGAVNSDWFEPCNWDKASVPTSTSPVLIPGGTINQPEIRNTEADCFTIDINSSNGAHLYIYNNQNGSLRVHQ